MKGKIEPLRPMRSIGENGLLIGEYSIANRRYPIISNLKNKTTWAYDFNGEDPNKWLTEEDPGTIYKKILGNKLES